MSCELETPRHIPDYFADHSRLSQSMLSLLKQSPELYKRRFIDGVEEREETDAMRLGSLVHCMVLEPKEFWNRYLLVPKVDRRTNAGKDTWRSFVCEAASSGKTLIDSEQQVLATILAERLENHDHIRCLLAIDHGCEVVLHFQRHGVECKSKLDYLSADKEIIFDIKTSQNASPEEFARSVTTYGYHRQAAMYCFAVKQNFGVEPRFIFGVVATNDPYLCGCYELDQHAISSGRVEVDLLIEELKQRQEENDWTSEFTKGINTLSLPRWYS